jgi:hypothetical protein
MGAKIPQQSNPSGCPLREMPYGHLKTAQQSKGVRPPCFYSAHMQLSGKYLPNNHTFNLLSGLRQQTFAVKLYHIGIYLSMNSLHPEGIAKQDAARQPLPLL